MSYGYSLRLIERNSQASEKKLGVRLGRVCIRHEIPVTVVANEFGVTRQTVYNWFTGAHDPHESHAKEIARLINSFKRK